MALPDTEASLLALYSPPSRLKINQYLLEGRIFLEGLSTDGTMLLAHVAGNRPRPYQVVISLKAPDLDAARCDCPAEGLCVHIGAAWIVHLRRTDTLAAGPLAERDAALASLRLSLSRQQPGIPEQPARRIPREIPEAPAPAVTFTGNPLDQDEPPIHNLSPPKTGATLLTDEIDQLFGGLPSEQGKPAGRADTKGERWALDFLIDATPTLNAQKASRRQLVIRPVLAYCRQDGGLGRYKEFKAAQLSEAPDDQARFWLESALALGGSLPVEQLLILAELPLSPALPVVRTAAGLPVRFMPAASVRMHFKPEIERYSKQNLVYQVQLEIALAPGDAPDSPSASFRTASWIRGLRHLVFFNQEGMVAWKLIETRLAGILDFLERQHHRLDPEGIERLAQRLDQEPVEGLSLEWSGRVAQSSQARGEPVITLESGVEGVWGSGPRKTVLSLEIDWDFVDGQAPASGWLQQVGTDGQGRATLWLRDLDWEEQVLDWLGQCLAETGLAVPDPGLADPDEEDGWRQSPFGDRFRAVPANGPAGRLRQLDARRQFSLPIELQQFLRLHAGHLMDGGFAIRLQRDGPVSKRGKVGIQVDRGMDWLDIEAYVDSFPPGAPGKRQRLARKTRAKSLDAGRREELALIQDLLQSGIARTPGGLIRLQPGDAERLQRLLDSGLDAGKPTRVATSNLAQLAALHEAGTSHIREIATAHELVGKLTKLDTMELLDPAPGFMATLRGYQRRGFSWLLQMQEAGLGACLADDMGLGKTVQALAALQILKAKSRKQPAANGANPADFRALLVVPVSTLPNWQSEAGRFTPDLVVHRHEGQARSKDSDAEFRQSLGGKDLVLVSYATLRQDQALFASLRWSVMLIDEAHSIKNPESATYTAVRSLPADFRISLTGTPVENSVLDLWAQLDFLNPGMLGSLKRFRSRYGTAIEERRDDAALATLRRLISPFILRRKKEDVARDLPPKEEIILYCDLEAPQRQVYEDIKEAYRLKVEEAVKKNGVSRSAITILEALLRLRQACLMPGVINPAWDGAGSAKLLAFASLVDDLAAEGHKALVFSQFVEVLGRLRAEMANRGIGYCYLDGQSQDRAESVARFQSDPAARVFLISLKAGGVGINLTAADYVVLFDPWWNPAVEAQAIDRAHRIGQDKPVIVYRLIARDTVEEKIMLLQQRKRDLAGTLVGGDEGLVKSLDLPELMELFG